MDALSDMRGDVFAWLDRISAEETLPEDIVAVLIGLFEAAAPRKGYALYLTGSRTFDEEDPDWSCNQDFVPGAKYLI